MFVLYVLSRMVETRTSSKKSGTGSTPPTGDQKSSPCSVSKTSRKRHAEDEMGVKKPRREDIISSATPSPNTEDAVENPSKDKLKNSDTSKGPKASSDTELKVQILALRSLYV